MTFFRGFIGPSASFYVNSLGAFFKNLKYIIYLM